MKRPTDIPPLKESVRYRLIPMYSVRLLIVVTDDMERSRLARNNPFGEPVDDHSYTGLCAYNGFRVGLFFERMELCHELIAHEIFHAAHRVLERAGVQFGIHNHEPFAHLNGWLTGLVYSELALMGERVKRTYSARKYRKGEPRLQFTPVIIE